VYGRLAAAVLEKMFFGGMAAGEKGKVESEK
jgi:hypothetical protein